MIVSGGDTGVSWASYRHNAPVGALSVRNDDLLEKRRGLVTWGIGLVRIRHEGELITERFVVL